MLKSKKAFQLSYLAFHVKKCIDAFGNVLKFLKKKCGYLLKIHLLKWKSKVNTLKLEEQTLEMKVLQSVDQPPIDLELPQPIKKMRMEGLLQCLKHHLLKTFKVIQEKLRIRNDKNIIYKYYMYIIYIIIKLKYYKNNKLFP